MPDMGAGTTIYEYATAADTLSLSPLVPNACIVRRISISGVNASDTWVVRTNGQEVGRFFVEDLSPYNLLSNYPKSSGGIFDIFSYCNQVLGVDLIYPVPEGKTITVSSLAGATADIVLEYEEFAPSALNPSLVNYPGGSYWIAPAYGSIAASVTAAGEIPIDTEISLDFVPNLFIRNSFPVNWTARILDLFVAGGNVNTYDGAADHLSNTRYVGAKKSGQRLFTRDAVGGIPVIGDVAGAGSFNNSNATIINSAPPSARKKLGDPKNLEAPLTYRPGYVYEWFLAIAGDVTGGADYSFIKQVAIVEYRSA